MYEPKPRAPGGPPQSVRRLAFAGWLLFPVLFAWAVVAVSGITVLWWGLVWMAAAFVYMIGYFKWAKKRYPKPSA